jgi:hypothetical protein
MSAPRIRSTPKMAELVLRREVDRERPRTEVTVAKVSGGGL